MLQHTQPQNERTDPLLCRFAPQRHRVVVHCGQLRFELLNNAHAERVGASKLAFLETAQDGRHERVATGLVLLARRHPANRTRKSKFDDLSPAVVKNSVNHNGPGHDLEQSIRVVTGAKHSAVLG